MYARVWINDKIMQGPQDERQLSANHRGGAEGTWLRRQVTLTLLSRPGPHILFEQCVRVAFARVLFCFFGAHVNR